MKLLFLLIPTLALAKPTSRPGLSPVYRTKLQANAAHPIYGPYPKQIWVYRDGTYRYISEGEVTAAYSKP